MKAVLISIKPTWCAKIASGEKTIEVRKTKPKLETPFSRPSCRGASRNIISDTRLTVPDGSPLA